MGAVDGVKVMLHSCKHKKLNQKSRMSEVMVLSPNSNYTIAVTSNLLAMASNLITSDGIQPPSDGVQPSSDGLPKLCICTDLPA